eukprot:5667787-Pyramimonas_sp.AAC.1
MELSGIRCRSRGRRCSWPGTTRIARSTSWQAAPTARWRFSATTREGNEEADAGAKRGASWWGTRASAGLGRGRCPLPARQMA